MFLDLEMFKTIMEIEGKWHMGKYEGESQYNNSSLSKGNK